MVLLPLPEDSFQEDEGHINMSTWRDLFHLQHEASLRGRGCLGDDGGGEVFVLKGHHVTVWSK